MFTVAQWLDLYKFSRGIRSDYRLAKIWGIAPSRISQYRHGRMRLPLWAMLKIAEQLQIEPLEIITSVEYRRTPERHQEQVKSAYFGALVKTIGQRMSMTSIPRYVPRWKRGARYFA